MGNVISEQLALFLRSILLGGALGLLYDLVRPLRRLGGRVWSGLLDALVSLTAAASLFFFAMAGGGELRLFILLGTGGGAVLFFCLLSRPLRPLWDFWFRVFSAPLWFFRKFLKKVEQLCKKLFSFWKNWFTITVTQYRRAPRRGSEGDVEMAQTPKAGKKRPSKKLTGLILVILIFGIGVQLNHMAEQLQMARAEEASYTQRLTELQETNARLQAEIENSQDPELMEDYARDELGMAAPGEKIFRFGS